MLGFPRRGFLARTQADDDVADANRLAGFHRQVTRLAVALVEQAERRDALIHRCRPLGRVRRVARYVDRLDAARLTAIVERSRRGGRHRIGRRRRRRLIPIIAGPAGSTDPGRQRGDTADAAPVHPSGVQAS